jgi:erythromycin esterase-like protein
MLGEASHGTHEYYRWRHFLSQELVEKHGFNFIAVEGDWPPSQRVNRFINLEEHETGDRDHRSRRELERSGAATTSARDSAFLQEMADMDVG